MWCSFRAVTSRGLGFFSLVVKFSYFHCLFYSPPHPLTSPHLTSTCLASSPLPRPASSGFLLFIQLFTPDKLLSNLDLYLISRSDLSCSSPLNDINTLFLLFSLLNAFLVSHFAFLIPLRFLIPSLITMVSSMVLAIQRFVLVSSIFLSFGSNNKIIPLVKAQSQAADLPSCVSTCATSASKSVGCSGL